jgi:hypothetical protein
MLRPKRTEEPRILIQIIERDRTLLQRQTQSVRMPIKNTK